MVEGRIVFQYISDFNGIRKQLWINNSILIPFIQNGIENVYI